MIYAPHAYDAFRLLLTLQNVPYWRAEEAFLCDRAWQDLMHKYTSMNRFYHTLNHVGHMAAHYRRVHQKDGGYDPAVLLAILYHDYVYDVQRTDNEEESAAAATNVGTVLKFQTKTIDIAHALILSTKGVQREPTLFSDLDFGILAAEPGVYSIYISNVRREYSHVPFKTYAEERTKILKQLLSKPIFYNPALTLGQAKAEEIASRNINREIRQLAEGQDPLNPE